MVWREKCSFLKIVAYVNLWYAFSARRVYGLLVFEGQIPKPLGLVSINGEEHKCKCHQP